MAAVLAFASSGLGIRAAGDVERKGVTGAAVLAVLMVAVAALGAVSMYLEPALFNVINGACLADATPVQSAGSALAGTGVRPEVAGVASPGPCGYMIPTSDFPSFYPAAIAAVVAGSGLHQPFS